MVDLWIRTDRDELRTECSFMVDKGGLLAVVGDRLAGRAQAARIAAAIFEEAGLRSYVVPEPGNRPGTSRYVMEQLVSWAVGDDDRADSSLSPRASNVGVPHEKMLEYCVESLRPLMAEGSPGFGIVVTALGQSAPPAADDLISLRRVWERVGGCWVVIGEDGPSWPYLDTATKKVTLRHFTRYDVARIAREIFRQKGDDLNRVSTFLDSIFPDKKKGRIPPVHAYVHLEKLAGSTGWA